MQTGNLVLTRNEGQSVLINGNIRITVADGGRTRLSIQAPRHISIVREELLSRSALTEPLNPPVEVLR